MNLKEMIKRGLSKKRQAAAEQQEYQQQHPAESEITGDQESLYESGRPQDVQTTRATSTRHGKVTADKRNQ